MGGHTIYDSGYLVVHDLSGLQDLCRCHPRFLLRQPVKPLQRIIHLFLSHKLLQIFF